MTLNDGIKSLMSSDPSNYALVHDSWTDGRYIQVSDNGINKSIHVLSCVNNNWSYCEQPFHRKNFEHIKKSGWHVISAEGLVRYLHKVDLQEKQEDGTLNTKGNSITANQIFNQIKDEIDSKYDTDLLTCNEQDYLNKLIMESLRYMEINGLLDDDISNISEIIVLKIREHVDNSIYPNLYKILYHLGLTKQDLDWIHNIEIKKGIVIIVDDLNEFDHYAALNIAKKRIYKALDDN